MKKYNLMILVRKVLIAILAESFFVVLIKNCVCYDLCEKYDLTFLGERFVVLAGKCVLRSERKMFFVFQRKYNLAFLRENIFLRF